MPFIATIDIEGFESDLFATNLGWLRQCYMVAIELHDWMLPGELTSRTCQQAMQLRIAVRSTTVEVGEVAGDGKEAVPATGPPRSAREARPCLREIASLNTAHKIPPTPRTLGAAVVVARRGG